MTALALVTALAAQATAPAASAPPQPVGSTPPAAAASASAAPNRGVSAYLDLEAGAGYSTNPLLRFGSNTGSGFGRIAAHGVYTRVSERTSTLLSGYAQNVFYINHYGAQQSFDVNGRHDARVSEQLRVFADADFAYDHGGQLDTIINAPGLPLPLGSVQPPVLVTPGSDFLSVTGRAYRAS